MWEWNFWYKTIYQFKNFNLKFKFWFFFPDIFGIFFIYFTDISDTFKKYSASYN